MVYKSGDYGLTWENVTSDILLRFHREIPSAELLIVSLQISTANSKIVYLFSSGEFSFFSENCGIDFRVF